MDRLNQQGDQFEIDRLKEQMAKKYGEDLEDPRLIKAEQMFSFDNYIKIQGQIEYILMLHCLRMVMLVKLINKSHNLKS